MVLAMSALPPDLVAITPSERVAAHLTAAGRHYDLGDPGALDDRSVDALALLDDELGLAGDHAEGLIDHAGRVLRPGGTLVVAARSSVGAGLSGAAAPGRTFTSEALRQAVAHRGFEVTELAAPGAAQRIAALAGAESAGGDAPVPVYDPDLDRLAGLLDAGPWVAAVAAAPASVAARSRTFFAGLPRKVIAAAVLCRDRRTRVLVVHDAFRNHWTIPGGVVDADEDPRAAAQRETREEAGLDVRTGALLGVFSASWPDRLVLVYAAEPRDPHPLPVPIHTHEIDDARWVPVQAALEMVAPHVRYQLNRCLDHPGGSWRQ